MPDESHQRGYKSHIINAMSGAGIGGVMGYVMSYITARGQDVPKTIEQYSMSQGVAGMIAGIMGGLLAVSIPYIVIPTIRGRRSKK